MGACKRPGTDAPSCPPATRPPTPTTGCAATLPTDSASVATSYGASLASRGFTANALPPGNGSKQGPVAGSPRPSSSITARRPSMRRCPDSAIVSSNPNRARSTRSLISSMAMPVLASNVSSNRWPLIPTPRRSIPSESMGVHGGSLAQLVSDGVEPGDLGDLLSESRELQPSAFQAVASMDDRPRARRVEGGDQQGGWARGGQEIEGPPDPRCAEPMGLVGDMEHRRLTFPQGVVGSRQQVCCLQIRHPTLESGEEELIEPLVEGGCGGVPEGGSGWIARADGGLGSARSLGRVDESQPERREQSQVVVHDVGYRFRAGDAADHPGPIRSLVGPDPQPAPQRPHLVARGQRRGPSDGLVEARARAAAISGEEVGGQPALGQRSLQ